MRRVSASALAAGVRLALAGLLLAASPALAGWLQIVEADAALDLARARGQALATVEAAPIGADAVAAAGWWLGNLDSLPEPEAILSVVESERDPELSFYLARIEAELEGRPPAGVLTPFELAGPFGVFDTLDLERSVVPADRDLPPLPTTWRRPAGPVRLVVRSTDGWAAPPRALLRSGVYLTAWSLELDQAVDGWLVVEGQGSVNLSLDGEPFASLRRCGEVDPGVVWYRVRLEPGRHRLRAEIASRTLPAVRLSLLGDDGEAVPGLRAVPEAGGPWAGATIAPAATPAEDALSIDLKEGSPHLEALLVAAALARGRSQPARERELLERAIELDPESPLPRLDLARLYLTEPTGIAAEEALRRAREQLRSGGDGPLRELLERTVAVREHRDDDADRLLDELVTGVRGDPRVLVLWVREALKRGWLREAEEGSQALASLIPASRRVAALRVDVLGALERWEERERLIRALAASEPLEPDDVERLADSSCDPELAIELLGRLRERFDDPGLDISIIRLLLESGAVERARSALAEARAQWGDLNSLEALSLELASSEEAALDAGLDRLLAEAPADLDLRTLAWRRGRRPFFAPFVVDALEIAGREKESGEGVDAVLILDQAIERVFADGSSLFYYHGLTRAVTPAGAERAAAIQQVPDAVVLRLRVVKPDGSFVVPPELPATDGAIVLHDVEAGDLVEEEYVSATEPTGTNRRGHLSPYIYRFADPERAFGLSEYLLLVPPDLAIGVEGRFEGLERSEWQEGDLRAIRWRAQRVPPAPREPFAPPDQDLLPWVTYGFGVSWADVGDALRDRVLAALRGTQELASWSAPLLTEADPAVAARRLVETLIDEIQPGRGDLDLGASAGESFSRRRGNRLLILARALLDAGWRVDLVLTRPLQVARTHLEVPTMEAFVEPLLRVGRGERTLWIDLGEERRGVDHIRPLLQGSDALVVPLAEPASPTTYLERLPAFANPDLEDRRRVLARIAGDGSARLEVSVSLRGAQAGRLREQVESLPEDRVPLVYVQVAVALFPGAEDVEGHLVETDDGVDLRLELALPNACEADEEAMTCRGLVLARPLVPVLASLPERRLPLVLPLPIQRRLELEVEPPPGWTLDYRPRRLAARWGSVEETLEHGGELVRSVLEIDLPATVVEPGDYPELARFCHAVDELVTRPPRLTPAGR